MDPAQFGVDEAAQKELTESLEAFGKQVMAAFTAFGKVLHQALAPVAAAIQQYHDEFTEQYHQDLGDKACVICKRAAKSG